MLFPRETWAGLADGTIRLAFRRWRRPTVRAGGTLRTPAGVLAIDAVDVVADDDITDHDAVRAGHRDRADVLAHLRPGPDRTLYRIAFHHAGEDPRVGLRGRDHMDDDELRDLALRLDRMDAHSRDGAWTLEVLRLIARGPGRRAEDLAAVVGDDKPRFKRRVRRLKELGLTESLRIGYRLSPRGEVLLAHLEGHERRDYSAGASR